MISSVADFLNTSGPTAFSFELLPPLRGKSVADTFKSVDVLMECGPAYINITTHRREVEYKQLGDSEDTYRIVTARRRPGTVAVAVALRERYGIPTVPHLICAEYSRGEIEDQLIDLSYMGIGDVLALRGDLGHGQRPDIRDGHEHANGLCQQIMDFNRGIMADGSLTEPVEAPISFGVAGYPEKHDEAMNLEADMRALVNKVACGARYVVTQMGFDNDRFFEFVKRCRKVGITVPIIPGLKPLTSLRQQWLLPKTFHIDLPESLAKELQKCKTNDQVKALGIEWGIYQARELKDAGVRSLHFYSMNATASVLAIAKAIF